MSTNFFGQVIYIHIHVSSTYTFKFDIKFTFHDVMNYSNTCICHIMTHYFSICYTMHEFNLIILYNFRDVGH